MVHEKTGPSEHKIEILGEKLVPIETEEEDPDYVPPEESSGDESMTGDSSDEDQSEDEGKQRNVDVVDPKRK